MWFPGGRLPWNPRPMNEPQGITPQNPMPVPTYSRPQILMRYTIRRIRPSLVIDAAPQSFGFVGSAARPVPIAVQRGDRATATVVGWG